MVKITGSIIACSRHKGERKLLLSMAAMMPLGLLINSANHPCVEFESGQMIVILIELNRRKCVSDAAGQRQLIVV